MEAKKLIVGLKIEYCLSSCRLASYGVQMSIVERLIDSYCPCICESRDLGHLQDEAAVRAIGGLHRRAGAQPFWPKSRGRSISWRLKTMVQHGISNQFEKTTLALARRLAEMHTGGDQ